MSSEASTTDRLLQAFNSNDRRRQWSAVLTIYSMERPDTAVIHVLVDAMNRLAAEVDDALQVRPILERGSLILAKLLDDPTGQEELRPVAETMLVELATSTHREFAATGANTIGDLGPRGTFAWDVLYEIAKRHQGVDPDKAISVRAIAYRAMFKVDSSRALALGDMSARTELLSALEHWLSQPQSEATSVRLQAELDALTRHE